MIADVAAEFAAHRDDELLTHGYVVAVSLAVARRRFGPQGTLTLLDDALPPITLLPVDLSFTKPPSRRIESRCPTPRRSSIRSAWP